MLCLPSLITGGFDDQEISNTSICLNKGQSELIPIILRWGSPVGHRETTIRVTISPKYVKVHHSLRTRAQSLKSKPLICGAAATTIPVYSYIVIWTKVWHPVSSVNQMCSHAAADASYQ